jgi:hypothetical protein
LHVERLAQLREQKLLFRRADAVVVDFPDDPLDLRLVYRRHGFEVIGTIQGVGASPPLAPMLRPPR